MTTDPFNPGQAWLADQIARTQPATHPALFETAPQAQPAVDNLEAEQLVIRVHADPVPQGSMIGYARGKTVVVQPANKTRLMPWRAAIEDAAKNAIRAARWTRHDGPVTVTIDFYLERPAAAGRRPRPHKRPDLDKLERAVLDALTTSGAVHDDSRIVDLHGRKHYADGRPAGAVIVVRNSAPVVSSFPVRPVEETT